MIDERAYLLERCLRLEAQLAGVAVAPPIPHEYIVRPMRHAITPTQVTTMRAMWEPGLNYHAIAQEMGLPDSTVRGRIIRMLDEERWPA